MKIGSLFLLTALITNVATAQVDTNNYSFFVAGHTYGAPGDNHVGLYPPFEAKFDYIRTKVGMQMGFLTGDMVGVPTPNDWDEVDQVLDSLNMPVHFIAGNHDVKDRPLFESRYGTTYYQFRYKDDLFIVLDPNIDGWSIAGNQLQFLKNTLNNYTDSDGNIFVFFHQILWRTNNNAFRHIIPNSSEGIVSPVNFWSDVIPLFTELPNKVNMFAGDVGVAWASRISFDKFRNINFISSGMGGTIEDNFLVVNVDMEKNVSYEVICLNDSDLNCLGDLEDHIIVDSLTSIEDLPVTEAIFNIFPNPASEALTISLTEEQPMVIHLYSLKGQLMLKKEFTSSRMEQISLIGYSKGAYMLTIQTPTGNYLNKIMIK